MAARYSCGMTQTAAIATALDADQVAQLDGAIAYRSRNAFGAEVVVVAVDGVHLIEGRIDEANGLFWVVNRRTKRPSMTPAGMRGVKGRSRAELAIQLAGEIVAAA